MKINKTIVEPSQSLQTVDLPKRKPNVCKSDRKYCKVLYFGYVAKESFGAELIIAGFQFSQIENSVTVREINCFRLIRQRILLNNFWPA